MKQDIQEEALEQLELDIRCGFDNEEEIFENILDIFYEEEDFDEEWLRRIIAEKMQLACEESVHWSRPTDFEKLVKVFDELTMASIVCLHNAGYTRQDGEADCMQTIGELKRNGIDAIGYCYYHAQDLERAIDPEQRNLYLGFDSPTQNDEEAIAIANKIVAALRMSGFRVNWPGTVDHRIEISDINWQKVADEEDWGPTRVIALMSGGRIDDEQP